MYDIMWRKLYDVWNEDSPFFSLYELFRIVTCNVRTNNMRRPWRALQKTAKDMKAWYELDEGYAPLGEEG